MNTVELVRLILEKSTDEERKAIRNLITATPINASKRAYHISIICRETMEQFISSEPYDYEEIKEKGITAVIEKFIFEDTKLRNELYIGSEFESIGEFKENEMLALYAEMTNYNKTKHYRVMVDRVL